MSKPPIPGMPIPGMSPERSSGQPVEMPLGPEGIPGGPPPGGKIRMKEMPHMERPSLPQTRFQTSRRAQAIRSAVAAFLADYVSASLCCGCSLWSSH